MCVYALSMSQWGVVVEAATNRSCAICGLAFAWVVASVSTTLANKALSGSVVGPLVLTIVQTSVCTVVSGLARLSETRGEEKDEWLCTWVLTMPALFILSIALNLVALEKVQITTWLVLRNAEPAIVQCVERFVPSLRKAVGALTLAAHAGLVVGACMVQHRAFRTGLSDGVGWCLAAIVSGALTRVWQAWLLKRLVSPRSALVCYNNVGGTILLGVYLVAFERNRLEALLTPACPWHGMLLSCVPATAMAFGTIHLQTYTSASHTAVLSCGAKIITIACGFIIFKESCDPPQLLGILLSLTSCALFCVTQFETPPPPPLSPDNTPLLSSR